MPARKKAAPKVPKPEPVPVVDTPEDSPVDAPEFQPEVVDEGVVRDEKKENPLMDAVNDIGQKPRTPGDWKKVSYEEVAKLEKEGKLAGYDPENGEALIKK